MSLRRALAGALLLLGVVVLALPAGAAPLISITSAVRNGTSAAVTGTAAFTPSPDPVNVGGTNTNLGPAQAAQARDAAGLDLVEGQIAPLADGSGLRFIWKVTNLPEQVPPEGVRYTWSVQIDGQQYQLQAKRTNMASITTLEDPVNHVQQLQEGTFFQLRGACTTSYEGLPTSGCYHLAFLDGAFDAANDRVYVDWPFETRDEIGRLVAPDFKPGAVLLELQTAGSSIAASLQAVVSTANAADFINGWNPYYVGKVVQLAAGAETANPQTLNYTNSATLTGDTFSATVSGVTDTKSTVFARACSALECSFTSALATAPAP